MIENDIYKALKRNFPAWDFQRIETSTHSGVPDLNYCSPNGVEGWIELKIGAPRLKPSQVAWLTKAFAMKRKAFVLSEWKGHWYLYKPYAFTPIDSKHFTPDHEPMLKSVFLKDISSFLTMAYV